MIDRLYEIAKLENNFEEGDDSYSIFIDKFPNKIDYDKFALLLINLEKQNIGLFYKDISQLGINNNNEETIARKLWKISTKGRDERVKTQYYDSAKSEKSRIELIQAVQYFMDSFMKPYIYILEGLL